MLRVLLVSGHCPSAFGHGLVSEAPLALSLPIPLCRWQFKGDSLPESPVCRVVWSDSQWNVLKGQPFCYAVLFPTLGSSATRRTRDTHNPCAWGRRWQNMLGCGLWAGSQQRPSPTSVLQESALLLHKPGEPHDQGPGHAPVWRPTVILFRVQPRRGPRLITGGGV